MKKFILPLLTLLTTTIYAQPKLAGVLSYYGQKNGGGVFRTDLPGSTPGVVYSFDHLSPNTPTTGVTAGDGNWLYGITSIGGANGFGAFYRINRDGTNFTKLYDLTTNYQAGTLPYYHTDGKVYFADDGNIITYNTADGSFGTINTFFYVGSKNFTITSDDWIYYLEGFYSTRLVKVRTDGTGWFGLHDFTDATEGYYPVGGVIEIPGDSLVGVMYLGSTGNGGSIYSIKKDGTGFAILHQFTSATGVNPYSKLVYFDGKIYGTTVQGGDNNLGVLFCINPDGSNYRVQYNFSAGAASFGTSSFGNIAIASNGRVFGSFSGFYQPVLGINHRLFKIDTSGANFESFFTGDLSNQQRTNGDNNQDILLVNDDEIFFTTYGMGRFDGGVLNQSDTIGTVWNDLYHYGYSSTGFKPISIMKASNGKLYGNISIGNTTGDGAIFSMDTATNALTQLHLFTDVEGYQLSGKLFEASDGKLYGACRFGGPSNVGSLFRIDKTGSNFQVIYDFNTFDGYSPTGDLVEVGGVLYGTCFYGGTGSYGVVFKINKDGSGYSVLRYFNGGTSDLGYPYCGLTRSGNWLFGVCGYGGATNSGGAFRIKTDGTGYQVLHEFNGTDGELPTSVPVIATNGKLYGTTAYGGANNNGTIFRVDSTGTNFLSIHQFNEPVDGSYPWSNAIQASDGLIYGSTIFGNNGIGGGNIFKINLDGTGFTTVHSFDFNTEGDQPWSLIDLNGAFVLPVQFLAFSAQKQQQSVLLNWKTAQERNSDRFEVERTGDANTAFTKIGTVAASGNTSSVTSYNFTDTRPLDGTNYYQLKQIDINGSVLYSKIVSVKFNNTGTLVISPNPATDLLNIQMPRGNDFTGIRIFDATGKLVIEKNIATASTNYKVDIHTLSKGWYMLKLQGKEESQEISFIKK